MDSTKENSCRWLSILLILVFGGPAPVQYLAGNDWEKFLEEKVSFGGFVENTTRFSDQ
jgi:hypothetical protein